MLAAACLLALVAPCAAPPTLPLGAIARFHAGPGLVGVAFSPNGKVLALVTPGDRRFRLASLTQDRPDRVLVNLASGYGHRLVYTEDSRLVALSNAADRSVAIYDVAAGSLVRRLMPTDDERS